MKKIANPEYLAKVSLLSQDEMERLLSRMGDKLDRRLEKNKLTQEEALAVQLEKEDEQLHEWRKVMHHLKERDEAKASKEAEAVAKKEAETLKEAEAKREAQAKKEADARETEITKAEKKAKAALKVVPEKKARAVSDKK